MLFGLSQNPFDRIAFLATRGRVDELEHPLEPFNLALGLFGANSAGFRNVSAPARRPPGNYIANQMPDIAEALHNGRLKVLLLLGTNMLSSFADAGRVAHGLDKAEMVACVDLFMNETARRFADVILPGTAWLEELGFKVTNIRWPGGLWRSSGGRAKFYRDLLSRS
jgi:anaerobic selenocysteine-containing dehydrogenase